VKLLVSIVLSCWAVAASASDVVLGSLATLTWTGTGTTKIAVWSSPFSWTATGSYYSTNYTEGGTNFSEVVWTNGAGSFSPSSSKAAELFVVAGGGGAGGMTPDAYCSGGGGAGGCLYFGTNLNAQTYTVTVGLGGAGGALGLYDGNNGSNSTFGSLTATGGGGGGGGNGGTGNAGHNGGSGGGASLDKTPGTGISGQGFAGGTGLASGMYQGGGGGGAMGVGSNAVSNVNGGRGHPYPGGIGRSFGGKTYATGGWGAWFENDGIYWNGTNAAPNTGDGGNGGKITSSVGATGGDGGSGIVIIRWASP